MRYLILNEIILLHRCIIKQSGGSYGIRDIKVLESAISQPRMSFEGNDLYPTIVEKASILAYSLIKNHPFVDGNKRIGHAAMETFLVLNDYEIDAPIDEQERIIFCIASGTIEKKKFKEWVQSHTVIRKKKRNDQ